MADGGLGALMVLGGQTPGRDHEEVDPEPALSELARRVSGSPILSRQELRERRWWVERYSIDDPERLPVHSFGPSKLYEAGWGVVFSSEDTIPEIHKALAPLLSLRQQQAHERYRVLTYRPGQDKLDFHPKRLAFFSPENDEATSRLSHDWIVSLAQKLAETQSEILRYTGPEASKKRLCQLLGGGETPSLLLLASHGLVFPDGDARRQAYQGALVCHDWPGLGGPLFSEHYFSAGDVPPEADLQGLIAFLLADFAGGDGSSLARLPQRLLRGGALAVVSLVDRSWGMSFGPTRSSRVEFARRVLQTLLAGEPLGYAMQFLNQLQAEVSVQLASASARNEGTSPNDLLRERFGELWRVLQDTRNLVVLGDPAVRLHDQPPTRTSRLHRG